MSKPRHLRSPSSLRDDEVDEFVREATRFFDGTLEGEPEVLNMLWEREATSYSAGPAATGVAPTPGFERDEPGNGAPPARTRSAREWDDIDPDEFGPQSHSFGRAPNTPSSRDEDELLQKLRSGEYTDPSIRADEFDEFAETHFEGTDDPFEPVPQDFSTARVSNALVGELGSDASRRTIAQEFLREISLRRRVRNQPLSENQRLATEALLMSYLLDGRSYDTNPTMDAMLADYIVTMSKSGPVAVLRSMTSQRNKVVKDE